MAGGNDILENPGVIGDLRDDWEDSEAISCRLPEFFLDSPELTTELVLSFRLNKPMVIVDQR